MFVGDLCDNSRVISHKADINESCAPERLYFKSAKIRADKGRIYRLLCQEFFLLFLILLLICYEKWFDPFLDRFDPFLDGIYPSRFGFFFQRLELRAFLEVHPHDDLIGKGLAFEDAHLRLHIIGLTRVHLEHFLNGDDIGIFLFYGNPHSTLIFRTGNKVMDGNGDHDHKEEGDDNPSPF